MKKVMFLLVVVLIVAGTSWAGGWGGSKWTTVTVQNQSNVFDAGLFGTSPGNGNNSVAVGQFQDNQMESLKVGQSFLSWGDGATTAAVASGNYGQDLQSSENEALLSQGANLETGTQVTTTDGWCWVPGSTATSSNSASIKQDQWTDVAEQAEYICASTTISGANGGGGVASNSVSTVQTTWTQESRQQGGWGGCDW